MQIRALPAIFATLVALVVGARADQVTLEVAYPIPAELRPMQEEIAQRFMERNPNVIVKFRAPAPTYDDLVQSMLRSAVTGDLPDVAFHAYNRVALLVDRGLPILLDPFIRREPNWPSMGYLPAALDLARVGGKVYGLPFNSSTPVVYYNADLLRRVGQDPDRLPATWPDIVELARNIKALGTDKLGVYFDYYDSAGNWTFLALVQSHGGQMMSPDNRDIAFGSAQGLAALDVLAELGKAGMVDMSRSQAIQAFSAGNLGILVVSTSFLKGLTERAGGRFAIRTGRFPLPSEQGRLPAGGNAAMMFTKDAKKQQAAWEFIKFASGPIGQTIVVNRSGYMPSNTLAIDDPNLLGDFYRHNPNHRASIEQLPVITGFFSFPGPNAIRITDVIRDHLRNVVTQRRQPTDVMSDMVRDVQALLP